MVVVTVIVLMLPKEAKFKFEYYEGRPWKYETLIAPNDLPILKSENNFKAERREIINSTKPYFAYNQTISDDAIDKGINKFDSLWIREYGFDDKVNYIKYKNFYIKTLKEIYERGIIEKPREIKNLNKDNIIVFVKNKVAENKFIGDFYLNGEFNKLINNKLKNTEFHGFFMEGVLEQTLVPNVIYDEYKSNSELKMQLDGVSPWDGVIQQGQLIISKGEVVSKNTYNILQSMKSDFDSNTGKSYVLIVIGQIILVSIPLTAFLLFLFYFRRDIFDENKNIILIFLVIGIVVFISRLATNINVDYLYIAPIMINILIIRSFYDTRLAHMVHITTVIIVSYFVPNSFQFLFLQVITGIMTIISIVKLHSRSQFFVSAIYIFFSYSIMYIAMVLITQGTFKEVDLNQILQFAINATLVLFAFPIIYVLEKVFGMVTDISLLEYADTNNQLIRDLASKAPGTFQHSVQVANLAEEAIREIGGNPLLVRAGAMYHDIGKSLNPSYFTENQPGSYNPHDDLSFEESARIIIDHVISGVEIARKHNIPEQIIDFIRTHHGTKRVEYFYRMSLKEKSIEEIDLNEFTYKGPIPYNRETCILMMSDAVEAASRSIKNPDGENISALVDTIIQSQIDENQYDNANITFRDINVAKKIFKKRLMSIYHVRIEYPD